MFSFFYKLKLLNYILGNLKELAVKVFLLVAYLYASSIVLMFLSRGFQYAVEFCSFQSAFNHLYHYLKWYYNNRSDLGYGISFRIIVAFVIPNLIYKSLCGANLQPFFAKKALKILKFFYRKKGGEMQSKNKLNTYGYNGGNPYDDVPDSKHEKVYKIKAILMHDITQITGQIPELEKIDQVLGRRLHQIFLSGSNKSQDNKPH